jgi:hypothetical protein
MRLTTFLCLMVFGTFAAAQSKPAARPTLEQQKMCSTQAKAFFKENVGPYDTATFTSHFDPKTTSCYIMIEMYDKQDDGYKFKNATVWNAFEGNAVASFYHKEDGNEYGNIEHPEVNCGPEYPCKTRLDFYRLVLQYFGVNH